MSTLRERTTGTAERLLSMRVRRLDIVLGFSIAFASLALPQAVLSTLLPPASCPRATRPGHQVARLPADGDRHGRRIAGLALGLLVSAFARNEFQAVRFLPTPVLPQFLVRGLFVPRDQMQGALSGAAKVMPMTYTVQTAGEAATHSGVTALGVRDAVLTLVCVIVVLVAGAATLKR
ncbi:ABC transporter permease [Streptomyces sp. NBC_00076]|uniref:ABC transporter permease n=1 Tax=Streptomyces sp. NBC_00076 TaxID=2975642 RepID=UPI003250913C